MRNLTDVERYLNSLINYEVAFPLGGSRDRPKLEPVYAAARRLELPLVLPKCLHIAGTVGKGSTAAFAQALLSLHHRVLSFTSPHLVSFTERVRLDGEDLPEELWCEGVDHIRHGIAGDQRIELTYFETVFVFYLWVSKRLGTSAHVVETGLGGSFDATNVLQQTTAVFTRIDFDHTEILGKTLQDIAQDKSGIIKPKSVAFTAEQQEDAVNMLLAKSLIEDSPLHIEGVDFHIGGTSNRRLKFRSPEFSAEICLELDGEYQRHNFAVALASSRSLDSLLTEADIAVALSGLRLDARQQYLVKHPNVLVDTCHNPASFRELAVALGQDKRFLKTIALVAMMKDKDARTSLAELRGRIDELWITEAPTPRSLPAEQLAEIAREQGLPVRVVDRESAYSELLALPPNVRGVVCGSFYLAGDFLKVIRDA